MPKAKKKRKYTRRALSPTAGRLTTAEEDRAADAAYMNGLRAMLQADTEVALNAAVTLNSRLQRVVETGHLLRNELIVQTVLAQQPA